MKRKMIYLLVLLAIGLKGSSQERISTKFTNDTIPFTLSNNTIFITGHVNGSELLKLRLDTDADKITIFKLAKSKGVNLSFVDSVYAMAADEKPIRPVSHHNQLKVENLVWENESMIYDDNYSEDVDGIVGYQVFSNNIVEVDYDKNILVIHDSSFAPGHGYVSIPIRFRGNTPYVQAVLASRDETVKGWFGINLGYPGSVRVGESFSYDHHLFNLFHKFGIMRTESTGHDVMEMELVKVPKVSIGGFEARNVTAELQKSGGDDKGMLGLDFLKRFNLVIDYQNKTAWIKPNSLLQTRYALERQADKRDPLFLPFNEMAISLGLFAFIVFLVQYVIRRRTKHQEA